MRKAGLLLTKAMLHWLPSRIWGLNPKIAKIGSSSFAGYLDYRNIWRDAFWI